MWARKSGALLVLLLLIGGSAARSERLAAEPALQDVVMNTGAEIVRAKCLTCHGADLIVQQRLTREGWSREIDKMVAWGASVDAAEREALLQYLTATADAPPQPPHAAAAAEEGAAILARRCLTCHDRRLIDQQRLTADGWRREVEKMIGWGATVSDSEKDLLVAYLAGRR